MKTITKYQITNNAASIVANAGRNAALAGKPRNSNPYLESPHSNGLYAWWDAGWLSVLPSEVIPDESSGIRLDETIEVER